MTTTGGSNVPNPSTRTPDEAVAKDNVVRNDSVYNIATGSDVYWLKEPDRSWRFWWKGAVPTGVFAFLSLYTLAIVAHRTENHLQLQVTKALQEQGLSWVKVHTEGLDVSLSGLPPSVPAARAAQQFAKQAQCNTWLGALPCVSRVRESFEQPIGAPALAARSDVSALPYGAPHTSTNAITALVAPNTASSGAEAVTSALAVSAEGNTTGPARFYDLKVIVSPVTVRLEGEVPDEVKKMALAQALTEALAVQRRDSTPQLDNRLTITPGVPETPWDAATKLAVSMAAGCTTGYVALHEATLTVDCETQTAVQRSNLIAAGADIPPGITVAGLNVLALDEIQQCEEALVKLVSRSQIRFTTNSASLLPTSRPLLREIAHQLQRCPGIVVVEGHTDAQGVRDENLTLSVNRARAVVASLIGYGVSEARVRAEGFGPDKPLASNENATGRAQNRRIEFRVARSSEFAPVSGSEKRSVNTSPEKSE